MTAEEMLAILEAAGWEWTARSYLIDNPRSAEHGSRRFYVTLWDRQQFSGRGYRMPQRAYAATLREAIVAALDRCTEAKGYSDPLQGPGPHAEP